MRIGGTSSLDKTISAYELIHRTQDQKTMLAAMRAMALISHEIERAVLQNRIHARIYAGFQRMSAFIPQVKTYQHMALYAETIYVFAHIDVPPPPVANIRFFPLPRDARLTREWFLVANARDFFTALVAEEKTPSDSPVEERVFEGIWSFDENMITTLDSWFCHLVKTRQDEDQWTHGRNYRHHANTMAGIVSRLTTRLTATLTQTTQANGELQIAPSEPLSDTAAQSLPGAAESSPLEPVTADELPKTAELKQPLAAVG